MGTSYKSVVSGIVPFSKKKRRYVSELASYQNLNACSWMKDFSRRKS